MDARDLEPSIPQQLLPVHPRTLTAREAAHHDHVERGADPVRAVVGDDVLGDEQLAVAFGHGGLEVGEDVRALLVGPVVENGVEVVCSCAGAFDGLWSEEVVLHDQNLITQPFHFFIIQHTRPVLQHKLSGQRWKFLVKRLQIASLPTTNIHNQQLYLLIARLLSQLLLQRMQLRVIPARQPGYPIIHLVIERAHAFWLASNPFPEILGRVVRELEGARVLVVILAVADLGEVFVRVLVRSRFEVIGELGEGGADDVEAV